MRKIWGIEMVNRTQYIRDLFAEIRVKDPLKELRCRICGDIASRHIVHINIQQDPSHSLFCSRACRDKYIFGDKHE